MGVAFHGTGWGFWLGTLHEAINIKAENTPLRIRNNSRMVVLFQYYSEFKKTTYILCREVVIFWRLNIDIEDFGALKNVLSKEVDNLFTMSLVAIWRFCCDFVPSFSFWILLWLFFRPFSSSLQYRIWHLDPQDRRLVPKHPPCPSPILPPQVSCYQWQGSSLH